MAMPSETDTAVPDELPPGMRRCRAIPGRARRAVMRIDAETGEGELGHVGAAHRDEAGGEHALHDGRVRRGRRRVGQHARTSRCRFAGDVEQVLQADRNARIAARFAPDATQRVHRVRHRARLLGVHLDEGARALAVRIGDAGETLFHQRAAGGAAVGQGLGMLLDRAHDAASPFR